MGGLIGTNSFLTMNKGLLTEDFNNYKEPITIAFQKSTESYINGPSFDSGILDVRGRLEYGWIIQTAYAMPFTGVKVTRSYSGSAGWTNWV